MTWRDLKLRVRALVTRPTVERELDDELTFHVEREARKYMDGGMDRDAALALARARFGSPTVVGDHCRDERGVSFIDDLLRDLSYAFRTFRRAPLAALTIVTTVGLGLGLVAVVFTFLNVFLFRIDEVRDPHELFAVERPRLPNDERVRFTLPDYDSLRRDTNVFTDAFAVMNDIDTRIDGRMMSGTLVTGNFFRVLGVSAALGRALAPADDDRTAPQPVVVLSHRSWTRLFSSDPNVVGRTLLVSGVPYEIVGVMPEGFRGLAVGPPDYWAPLSSLGQVRPIHAGHENTVGIEIIGRLGPGVSQQAALAGLTYWANRNEARDHRQATVVLEPRQGTVPQPAEALLLFAPLFFAFGLILMIGCANVANMLLARGVSRQREFGIRLSLGASRRRIVRQLLTESLLLALASAVLGLVVSRVVLEGSIYAIMTTMAPDLAENVRLSVPAFDWRVLLFLVGGAIASTVFFGLAPALQTTRLDLVRTVRGDVAKDVGPGRARNVLIGVQVAASALLLICSAVFLRSALAASQINSGLRTADTVMVDIVNEPFREAMIRAVVADPTVVAMAASSPDPLARPRMATASTATVSAVAPYRLVSSEYFDVLGIDILRGRGFTLAERDASSAVVVVSDSMARELWPNVEAVGQLLQLDPAADPATGSVDGTLPARTFAVVGVTRDVKGFRVAGFSEAGMYLPTSASTEDTALTVRVQGNPDQVRIALLQRLTAVDPNMGQVVTMRTLARMETYFLQMGFWLTLGLGGLALVLTLSGLFSVLSYVVAQRTREMGVRIALGATTQNVMGLVLAQSLRPVGIGLVIGSGLAIALASALMTTPMAAQIGAIVHVFDPVAYASSMAVIVAACVVAALLPAIRAANVDPVASLKNE